MGTGSAVGSVGTTMPPVRRTPESYHDSTPFGVVEVVIATQGARMAWRPMEDEAGRHESIATQETLSCRDTRRGLRKTTGIFVPLSHYFCACCWILKYMSMYM